MNPMWKSLAKKIAFICPSLLPNHFAKQFHRHTTFMQKLICNQISFLPNFCEIICNSLIEKKNYPSIVVPLYEVAIFTFSAVEHWAVFLIRQKFKTNTYFHFFFREFGTSNSDLIWRCGILRRECYYHLVQKIIGSFSKSGGDVRLRDS